MNKHRTTDLVFLIVLVTLQLEQTLIVADEGDGCLVGKEFEAKLEGLQASISRGSLVLRGCGRRYHLYSLRTDPVYFEDGYNSISFRQIQYSSLCDPKYGPLFTGRLQNVRKFRLNNVEATQQLELYDETNKLMVMMIFQPSSEFQRVRETSLQGKYIAYLPPVKLYFASAGKIIVEGCSNVTGIYGVYAHDRVYFSRLSSFGHCASDYDGFILSKIENSAYLKLTDGNKCQFSLTRNSDQLEIVAQPVQIAQEMASLAGNYTLYLIGSNLTSIDVNVSGDEFKFKGCGINSFSYALQDDGSTVEFGSYSTTMDRCQLNNDKEYISYFHNVVRYEFIPQIRALQLFGNQSDTPIYSTSRQKYLEMRPIAPLIGEYSFNLADQVSGPMIVSVAEDTEELIRLTLRGCNLYRFSLLKAKNNRVRLSGLTVSKTRKCEPDNDQRYVDEFRSTARMEFDPDIELLKFVNERQLTALKAVQYKQPTETPQQSSLVGLRALIFPDSDLRPIEVTVSEDNNQYLRFMFRGCNQYNLTYKRTDLSHVSLSSMASFLTTEQCPSDQDDKYISRLRDVVKMVANPNAKQVQLQSRDSRVVAVAESSLLIPLNGQYVFDLPGSNMTQLRVIVANGRFRYETCNAISFAYAIKGMSLISFSDPVRSDANYCEPDDDARYYAKFLEVQGFAFHERVKKLELRNGNGDIVFTTREEEERDSAPRAVVGSFNFTFPDSGLKPVAITAMENEQSVELMMNGCNVYNFTFVKGDPDSLFYSRFVTKAKGNRCPSDSDDEYVQRIKQIVKVQYDSNSHDLAFYDQIGDLIMIPSHSIGASLAGEYIMFLVGSSLKPLTVTVTDRSFSFSACNLHSFSYLSPLPNAIKFTNFASSQKTCLVDDDSRYLNEFRQVVRYEFDLTSKIFKLFDSASGLIYSSLEQDYLSAQPQSSSSKRYRFSFSGANIESVWATVTESESQIKFAFEMCNYFESIFSKSSLTGLEFVRSSNTFMRNCEPNRDYEYLYKFDSILKSSFNKDTLQLTFASNDRVTILGEDQIEQSPKSDSSMQGEYMLYRPHVYFDSIQVNAVENNQVIGLMFKGCKTFNATFMKHGEGHVEFLRLASPSFQVYCASDNDQKYIRLLKQVKKITTRLKDQEVDMENEAGAIILTSRNQTHPLLVGNYSFVPFNLDLSPVIVQLIEDQNSIKFIYPGCNRIGFRFAKTHMNRVYFDYLMSPETVDNCISEVDKQYDQLFREIVQMTVSQNSEKIIAYNARGRVVFTSAQVKFPFTRLL